MGIEIAACGEGNVVIGLEGGSYLNENKINGLVVEKVGSRFRSLRQTYRLILLFISDLDFTGGASPPRSPLQ